MAVFGCEYVNVYVLCAHSGEKCWLTEQRVMPCMVQTAEVAKVRDGGGVVVVVVVVVVKPFCNVVSASARPITVTDHSVTPLTFSTSLTMPTTMICRKQIYSYIVRIFVRILIMAFFDAVAVTVQTAAEHVSDIYAFDGRF